MSVTVGSTVMHPSHGAAVVAPPEQRDLGNGELTTYVVLVTEQNGLTVKLPESQLDEAGVRPCMSEERLAEILEVLESKPTPQTGHWSRRLKANQARMRSGEPTEVAMVVRDLTAKMATKGLSPAEQRLHRTARRLLHGEISAIVSGGAEGADELLDGALAEHLGTED